MTPIVAIHAFRPGTGNSILTAYLAIILAQQGYRVGAIEMRFSQGTQSILSFEKTELHSYLGITLASRHRPTLQDYLWKQAPASFVSYPAVLPALNLDKEQGRVYCIPWDWDDTGTLSNLRQFSQGDYHESQQHWNLDNCSDVINDLVTELQLDYVLIDLPAGLNPSILTLLGLVDCLLLTLCPDRTDFQNTAVLADLAKRLDIPHRGLVLNQVPDSFDFAILETQVYDLYNIPVFGYLPFTGEIRLMQADHFLANLSPHHVFGRQLWAIVQRIQTLSQTQAPIPAPTPELGTRPLTMLDVLMLPQEERQLVHWILQHDYVTPTQVAQYCQTSLALALGTLEKLVRQGILSRKTNHNETQYRSLIHINSSDSSDC